MFVGIDISYTNTAICYQYADQVFTRCFKFEKENYSQIRKQIKIIVAELQHHNTRCIAIEDYSYASKRTSGIIHAGELGGLIKSRLKCKFKNLPIVMVPPTVLKKYASGSGQSKKEELRLHVYKKWGFEAKTNDEIDAYVLAKISGLFFNSLNNAKAQFIAVEQAIIDKVRIL